MMRMVIEGSPRWYLGKLNPQQLPISRIVISGKLLVEEVERPTSDST